MRRLVQGRETIDPAESRLAELVRAAEKTSVNPFRRRAILYRLQSNSTRFPWLRSWTGGVAGVLLVGTATAGSLTWWREHEAARRPQPEPIAMTALSSVSTAPHSDPAPPNGEAQPVLETAPPAPHPSAVRASSHPHAKTRPGEDPTAVVQAIRALRTEHDPWRAEDLLQSYVRAYPRGALAEEALALQIEAARARHDAIAVERAERYLRLYPNGPYRRAAESALQPSP
jgi:hypothetical protein